MRFIITFMLGIACFCNVYGFSVWTVSGKIHPLEGNINTIYVMRDCLVGNMTVDVIKEVAGKFSPSTYITGAPTVSQNVIVVDALPTFSDGTVIIQKDSINSAWAMSCQTYSSSLKFKVYFNTTVSSDQYTKAKLLHEFGHGVGLGHTNKASHVMQDNNSQISFLKEDEIQGLYSQYAPPEFVSEEPIAISKGKNKVKLSFKPASKIINQSNDYKIELYYDDGNISNTEKIDNELPISFTDVTDYYWEFNAPANCKYRLKSYVYLTEDCKGKSAAINISNRDEPVKIIETKLFELIPADSAKLLKGDKTGVEVHKPKTTEPKSIATYTLSIDGTEVQQLFFAGDTLATFNWNTTDLNPGEHILKVLEKSGITKESRTVDSSLVKLFKPVILSPTPDDWNAQWDTTYFLPGAICQNDTLTLDQFNIKNLKADYTVTGPRPGSGSSSTGQRIWGWKGWVFGQQPKPQGNYTVNLNLSCADTTYTPASSSFFVSRLHLDKPQLDDNIFALPGKVDTLRYWITKRPGHPYPKIKFKNTDNTISYLTQGEAVSVEQDFPGDSIARISYLWDQSNVKEAGLGDQLIRLYFPPARLSQKSTFHSTKAHFYFPYFYDDFSKNRGWHTRTGTAISGGVKKGIYTPSSGENFHANTFNKPWCIINSQYKANILRTGYENFWYGAESPGFLWGEEYFDLYSPSFVSLRNFHETNHAYLIYKYKTTVKYPANSGDLSIRVNVNLFTQNNKSNNQTNKNFYTVGELTPTNEWKQASIEIPIDIVNSNDPYFGLSFTGLAIYCDSLTFTHNLPRTDIEFYIDDVGIMTDINSVTHQHLALNHPTVLVDSCVSLNWKLSRTELNPENYTIYRNGDSLANITNTSFTDLESSLYNKYSYGISAVYSDGYKSNPNATLIHVTTPKWGINNCLEDFEGNEIMPPITNLPYGWNCDAYGSRAAFWYIDKNSLINDLTDSNVVCFNVCNSFWGDSARLLTRPYNLSEYLNPALQFNMQHSTLDPANNDYIQLQVYTKANGWQNIGTPYYRYNGSSDWATYQIDLSSYAGLDYLLIGFVGVNRGGQNIYLDNIEIKTSDSPNMMISGTHNINSDLIIPENKTLILQPGAKLLFAEGVSLQVNGKMVADGSTGKITLSSQEPGTTWQGIYGNRSNTISLKNVKIENTLMGVSRFDSVAINNCQFTKSEDAVNLYQPLSVEIKNSRFENCIHAIEVNVDDKSINCPVTIEQDTLINTEEKYKTGINIFNAGTVQSIIKNNVIANFNIGIGLAYGNALCQNNDITGGEYGMQLFESSPVLLNNRIYNNDYGIYTVGYAAPLLNPFASKKGYGGYNCINSNSLYQLYYDQNSQICLDNGYNDIYSETITNPLIFLYRNNAKSIYARANYWGSKFNPQDPAVYFQPWNGYFYFIPYSTSPNVLGINNKDLPEDLGLNKFDLALKREVTRDNSTAGVLFAELLNQLPENAAEILPRVEYNGNQGKKRSVYESLHDKKLITDFTYYSFLAREAFHNGNDQSAADFYHLKLDSSEVYNDSLIAKINLLDLYWSVNKKGNIKLSRQLKDLVCKDAKEYAAKREKLLAELLGTSTGIATDNTVKDFSLFQNYPNPFNPVTSIKYALPEAGNVKIKVYNLAGALVSEINEGNRKTGYHTAHFSGNQLASGVYIYLLEFNGSVMMTKKMVMLK